LPFYLYVFHYYNLFGNVIVTNFEGTKLGVGDPASVTEFLKRITTFTHFAWQLLQICITNATPLILRYKLGIEWKTTIENKESKNNEGPDFDITFKQTRLKQE
jgi:hypothetical protein